ncbi:MAG: RDD family protein [Gammaproteobacteria bacterium]|nr:RDD family protein [Gammaproteobacteria bacterium]
MQTATSDAAVVARRVSVRRRVAAAFYDALALIGIWFVVAGIAVGLHRGEAVTDSAHGFHLALLLAAWGYFAGCWRRGGQTLGMKSWRIRVVDAGSGAPLSWRQASLRFIVAVLHWLPLAFAAWAFWFTPVSRGLVISAGALLAFGYWWFLGGRGVALIDRASGSVLVFRA